MNQELPKYDDNGINVFDPYDRSGKKSTYITLLHEYALLTYLPNGTGECALDVGCGYGRLTEVLSRKGWDAIGIDPSENLISHAIQMNAGVKFLKGSLPDLPVEEHIAGMIFMQGLLRPLMQSQNLNVLHGIKKYVKDNGYIVVVENIRDNSSDYVAEGDLVDIFKSEGFNLLDRTPIRAGRWWITYLIRYGLIPMRYFTKIANMELSKMRKCAVRPKFQYHNVMFIFKKEDG